MHSGILSQSEHWFVAMTRPQGEPLAFRDLRRLGFEVFWPHTTEWVGTAHKSKARLVKRSWLSRYLFVRSARSRLHNVNDAMGISTLVYAAGSEPFPVPDHIIQEMQDQCDPLGYVMTTTIKRKSNPLKIGDMVCMGEKSPLFGFWLEVIKVIDAERVSAMFNALLFGSAGREIEINVADIGEVAKTAPLEGQSEAAQA